MIHMWDRSKIFLGRMGGVILVGSVVIWGLANFPRPATGPGLALQVEQIRGRYAQRLENAVGQQRMALERQQEAEVAALQAQHRAAGSLLGMLGRGIAPVFAPIGVDWRGGIALLSGFVAKEIVLSTLGVLHAVTDLRGGDALRAALIRSGMTPRSALAMMVFVLLYLPCLATVTAIRRETGSWKWMALSIMYNTSVAWMMAFTVFQAAGMFGL